MAKTRRSGNKNAGLTRNQKRKQEYAAMRAEERAGKIGKRRARRSEKTWIHETPCGNPACRKCYVRYMGVAIVSRDQEAFMNQSYENKKVI